MTAKAKINRSILGWIVVACNDEAAPILNILYGDDGSPEAMKERFQGSHETLDVFYARVKEVASQCKVSIRKCGKPESPTLHLWVKPDTRKPWVDPETLECMKGHGDGAHCGLADWYPDIEKGIQDALRRGKRARWTTGWYSSKKEIASACITHDDGKIVIEVSVSDDFDTGGCSEVTIPHTVKLRKIEEAIWSAWELAEENQKDNRLYVGFSILNSDGGWSETYIRPRGFGVGLSRPPGDNYHKWGFQGECKIPKAIKEMLEQWIERWYDELVDAKQYTYMGWTVKPWDV